MYAGHEPEDNTPIPGIDPPVEGAHRGIAATRRRIIGRRRQREKEAGDNDDAEEEGQESEEEAEENKSEVLLVQGREARGIQSGGEG